MIINDNNTPYFLQVIIGRVLPSWCISKSVIYVFFQCVSNFWQILPVNWPVKKCQILEQSKRSWKMPVQKPRRKKTDLWVNKIKNKQVGLVHCDAGGGDINPQEGRKSASIVISSSKV